MLRTTSVLHARIGHQAHRSYCTIKAERDCITACFAATDGNKWAEKVEKKLVKPIDIVRTIVFGHLTTRRVLVEVPVWVNDSLWQLRMTDCGITVITGMKSRKLFWFNTSYDIFWIVIDYWIVDEWLRMIKIIYISSVVLINKLKYKSYKNTDMIMNAFFDLYRNKLHANRPIRSQPSGANQFDRDCRKKRQQELLQILDRSRFRISQ